MWSRKKRRETMMTNHHTDAIIAHVQSQDEEVAQIVNRLENREPRNHFVESMERALRGGSHA